MYSLVVLGLNYFVPDAQELDSQASRRKIRSVFNLDQAVRAGKVLMIFVYEQFYEHASDWETVYWFAFRHGAQYGAMYNPDCDDYAIVRRRPVGVEIDGTYISVPRRIFRGLSEKTLRITRDDHVEVVPILKSQSSAPKKRGEDQFTGSDKDSVPNRDKYTVRVDAGAHHSQRMRAVKVDKPSMQSFSMSSTFHDEATRQNDIKMLQQRMKDMQRPQFASHAGVQSKQIRGLKETMREMRILVPGPYGSMQEEIRSVPVASEEEPDDADIGV